MSPRPATIADYKWLYEHANYMPDGLKCAREALLWLTEAMPGSFLDIGGGRGHVGDWMMQHTRCEYAITVDPALGDRIHKGATRYPPTVYDAVGCFDVLEHLDIADVFPAIAEMRNRGRYRWAIAVCCESDIHAVNGENVQLHLTIEHHNWWHCQIERAFPDCSIQRVQCPSAATRHTFLIEKLP